ncbi:hypothetical protein Tco_0445859 [Tanacetum coccineum]
MRNKTFMHTARDDSLLCTMRFISRHADTQVYGAIIPKAMTNQALLDSVAYKTYYAIASGAKPPKSRKSQKKSDSAISSEKSPSNKKYAKTKKVVAAEPKPTKKKTPGVPDEQHRKTSNTDEGTGTKPGVLDVLKYYSKGEKESWGDSGEEDDDTNDDEEETDSDRTKSNRIKIPVLNQSTTKYYEEEEEEKFDNEEKMDEEDDEVTKELYKDVNVNSGNEDIDMTDADQGS